ncbi:hypothetical protein EG329_005133 [Mollisiaceae sp. DMI_Dod_QoI]|nr:hypothetical protein EG329_005133 [Helotiales sp. DMI_Dod_QoI]
MSSLFAYQPLNGENPVRFLSLLPSELDGAIRCEIHHDDLSNHQPYHAVSYTWGAPKPTALIQVSGKQLPVRKNLFLFLKAMAEANSDGLQRLWIDALCIDQSNIEEKNQQVPQMGRIYSGAQSVLIWLGPASSKTDFAFDAFERVRKQFEDIQDSDFLLKPTAFINAMPTGEEWEHSILDLLNREYWTRVWIVQELFLTARGRVICGSRIMHLEDLETYCSNMRFLNMLSCQKLQTSPGFKICCRAARYKTDRRFGGALSSKEKTASTQHAWALVNWVVDQHCSDIRDKLYGLLGIAADGPGFVVDYSSCCASLLFKAIRHFPLLNSLHSVDHLRKLLGLAIEDLAEYIRTYHGPQEEEVWISVFMEPFSSYVGDRDQDQVFDCRLRNKGVELQADDIIFDFDGRDDVPKEVLLFRKEASSYVCLAVISVYPAELKEPPICRDEEVPQPRQILIGLVDNPVFRSLTFSEIRQRSHGEPSSENVEILIPPDVILFLMWCQTPFESTKGLPPEAIRGNPLQAASWCRSRRDATRRSLAWHNFMRYDGSGNSGQEEREGKSIYWS